MVAEPEVLTASVESTSERKVCPELALGWRQRRPRGPTPQSSPSTVAGQHSPLQALNLIQCEVKDAGQVVVGAPGRGEVALHRNNQRLNTAQRLGTLCPATAVLPPPMAVPQPAGTHAGDGVLQQELGPLPPHRTPLLLLELPREQAARRDVRRDTGLGLRAHLSLWLCSTHLSLCTYLLFPLLFSSQELPSPGAFSGSTLLGGFGGTRIRRRKMHFFFLISFPHRNLGRKRPSARGEERTPGGQEHFVHRSFPSPALTCSCSC